MNQTELFTRVFESVFNSGTFSTHSSIPVIVNPFDTGPTAPPFNLRPNKTPFYKESAETPIYKGPDTAKAIDGNTTVKPIYTRTQWKEEQDSRTVPHQGSTFRAFFSWPTTRERWNLKPPDKEHKPQKDVSTSNRSSTHLENLLWVALGGIVVLALIAILMKIGRPIRRVRRQRRRLNAQPATDVSRTTRRQDPDDRYMDMGSLLRLTDTNTEPVYDDLPPPYSVCVPNINKRDTEEPPPRFSACFVTYTNSKDVEPKVHIPHQKVTIENGLTDVSIAMDESEDFGDIRTELILVNGRIVEKPKLHLNGNNDEIVLTSNDKVEERRSRRTDLKGRIVRINANFNDINVY